MPPKTKPFKAQVKFKGTKTFDIKEHDEPKTTLIFQIVEESVEIRLAIKGYNNEIQELAEQLLPQKGLPYELVLTRQQMTLEESTSEAPKTEASEPASEEK